MLPVGRSRIFPNSKRIYALGLIKKQVEDLPEFSDELKIDYNYEEQVRGIYRNQPVEASPPLGAPTIPAYKAHITGATSATNVNHTRDK